MGVPPRHALKVTAPCVQARHNNNTTPFRIEAFPSLIRVCPTLFYSEHHFFVFCYLDIKFQAFQNELINSFDMWGLAPLPSAIVSA